MVLTHCGTANLQNEHLSPGRRLLFRAWLCVVFRWSHEIAVAKTEESSRKQAAHPGGDALPISWTTYVQNKDDTTFKVTEHPTCEDRNWTRKEEANMSLYEMYIKSIL